MSDSAQDDALPPHEVFEEIARGLFGVVYRARDVANGRFVALKVIRGVALTTEDRGRFLREVRAAAQLNHPHLLPILAVGLHEGLPCYTTPIAPNGRLSERREQFADARAAADVIEKAARAVAAAHAHGLVHGLLKPSEVLFDANDQPLVGGFGLLPLFHSIQDFTAGWCMGNVARCSPEQISGKPGAIEPADDVWALGVILYELLTGRCPFDGATAEETIRRIRTEGPVAPRRLRASLGRELEAVVLRCLQKKPEDRYGSARVLADDLERWLRAEPTEARPESWWGRFLRAL